MRVEYKCKQCKKHTEKIQKFSDPEITECPHCGGPLERVVSAAAISFKGGGWFKDGYSHAKPKSSSKSESKTKSDSGASAVIHRSRRFIQQRRGACPSRQRIGHGVGTRPSRACGNGVAQSPMKLTAPYERQCAA